MNNKELIAELRNGLNYDEDGDGNGVVCEGDAIRLMNEAADALEAADKQGEPVDGISRIYQICNRYESGYGHGLKRDGLDLSKTPHGDSELGEAYQIGYEAGSERFEADKQGEAVYLARLARSGFRLGDWREVNKDEFNEYKNAKWTTRVLYTHPQPDRKAIEDEVIERCAKAAERYEPTERSGNVDYASGAIRALKGSK